MDRHGKPAYRVSAVLKLIQDCVVSSFASLSTIILLRWSIGPIPLFSNYSILWIVCSGALTAASFAITGAYKISNRFSTIKSASFVLLATGIKMLLQLLLALTCFKHLFVSFPLTVLFLFIDLALSSILLMTPFVVGKIKRKYTDVDIKDIIALPNALVYGDDDDAFIYANEIKQSKKYNVLGLLSDNPNNDGLVIGDFIVFYGVSKDDVKRISWKLGGVDCVLFPKNLDKEDSVSPTSMDRSDINVMSGVGRILKRSFDIVGSLLLMIVFSPLAAICAVAVKCEDGGPVLYRQERLGLSGKPFNILKFRSMRTDAERDGAKLYAGEKDPRLTRTGAFMRAHHLDELPQLWNVFIGDMSFVGYRPERQFYISQIEEINPRYRYLYQIRPGVTSYATLYNGYTDTLEKMLTRLDLDLYYLRHHSVYFDMKVLWMTFVSIVTGKKF